MLSKKGCFGLGKESMEENKVERTNKTNRDQKLRENHNLTGFCFFWKEIANMYSRIPLSLNPIIFKDLKK